MDCVKGFDFESRIEKGNQGMEWIFIRALILNFEISLMACLLLGLELRGYGVVFGG